MSWDLKKEEDVKQYLSNLNVEYRFGCYSEKKPEGTYLYNISYVILYLFAPKTFHLFTT